MDFWNFFTIYVFEVRESIADIPTELPCSGDLENSGHLPVREVFEVTQTFVPWQKCSKFISNRAKRRVMVTRPMLYCQRYCHFTSCHVVSRHATSLHVTSCHVMSLAVTSCHVGCPEGCRLHTASAVYHLVFFSFFYSPFVLGNYSTDSHQIFRNCVFWCSLNNPVVLKFFWRHLAEKHAKKQPKFAQNFMGWHRFLTITSKPLKIIQIWNKMKLGE